MREQLQDDDPAASKWKVAMIGGEGKGEDRPIAGSMQGMIFCNILGDLGLIVHQKVMKVICQMILRKWKSSIE